MRALIRRHPVGTFFVLTFSLAWWPWPLTAANPDSIAMVPFAPIFVALLVARVADGPGAVRRLLSKLVHWRVHIGWYAVAFGLPTALAAGAVGVARLFGAGSDSPDAMDDAYALPVALLAAFFVKGPLWEELGWRGFALPRMQKRRGPLVASLVLGVIWGLWHLPLLVSGDSDQRPIGPYLTWIVATSVLLTWVYNGTGGSVLLVTLYHAVMNTITAFFLPMYEGPDYVMAFWVMAALTAVAAAVVTIVTRGTLGWSPDAEERAASIDAALRARRDSNP